MSTPFEFDVFLSHSSKDKPAVRALAERLRAAGLKVWFDAWEIKLGDSIFAKVEYGLEHSRKLLLCMSANAFESDWATLEQQTVRFRDPLNRGRGFIPLKLDDTPPKGTLAGFLYLDWRTPSDDAFQMLLEACQAEPDATTSTTPTKPGPITAAGLATVASSTPPAAPLKPPDFASFAASWPHATSGLQLQFIDPAQQAINKAHCAPSHEDCDDCVLRLTSSHGGQLALFYQSSDGSFMQMLPNSDPASKTSINPGVHTFPGSLLPLPCATLGPKAVRIHFTAPGTETALAFLLPTLPDCISARAPLFDLDSGSMSTILQTLHGLSDASMALASIQVLEKR